MLRDVLQVISRRTTGRTDRGRTTTTTTGRTTGRTSGRTDGQRTTTTTGHDGTRRTDGENILYLPKSKSTDYPKKQARTNVSRHAHKSVNQCASFTKICFFCFY